MSELRRCVGTFTIDGYIARCDACPQIVTRSAIDDFGEFEHWQLERWTCEKNGHVFEGGKCGFCGSTLPDLEPKPPIDWTYLNELREKSKKKKPRVRK